ncbi:chromosome-associated kinesin KIF4-like [Gopherus flavomarginatus]|uniref:chromosome-associated kinesin KIF4-like n=1 Tax=Gopherus flavomarginatus TaxID=286002 RepID=UPI0021CC2B1E|nr:chromosome-associated kinesin KIF4-like [Gopherus flavomarginatus]
MGTESQLGQGSVAVCSGGGAGAFPSRSDWSGLCLRCPLAVSGAAGVPGASRGREALGRWVLSSSWCGLERERVWYLLSQLQQKEAAEEKLEDSLTENKQLLLEWLEFQDEELEKMRELCEKNHKLLQENESLKQPKIRHQTTAKPHAQTPEMSESGETGGEMEEAEWVPIKAAEGFKKSLSGMIQRSCHGRCGNRQCGYRKQK